MLLFFNFFCFLFCWDHIFTEHVGRHAVRWFFFACLRATKAASRSLAPQSHSHGQRPFRCFALRFRVFDPDGAARIIGWTGEADEDDADAVREKVAAAETAGVAIVAAGFAVAPTPDGGDEATLLAL